MIAVTGGCACGAVSYRAEVAPVFSIQCHCRQCQRITGTGHASQFTVPASAVTIAGELREYPLVADSGNRVVSAFCPTCGSPVLKRSSGYTELVFFHAATLADVAAFKADKAVWTETRQPWDYLDPMLDASRSPA